MVSNRWAESSPLLSYFIISPPAWTHFTVHTSPISLPPMSPLCFTILLLLFFSLLSRFVYNQLYYPYLVSLRFSRQGITGPTRRIISGNAPDYRAVISKAQSTPLPCIHHDVVDRVAPFFSQWTAQFGRPFVYWFGSRPRFVITDPNLVKTVLLDTTGLFEKRQGGNNPLARQLIGEGLPGLDGSKWAHHRRIIAPAFNMERVKVSVQVNILSGTLCVINL